MLIRIQKTLPVIVLFFSLSVVTPSAIAATQKEKTNQKPAKKPWYYLEFATAVGVESESNIFLTENKTNADIKSLLRQDIRLKIPQDKLYAELDFTTNLAYYLQEGDHTQTIDVNGLLNFQPTETLSLGFRDLFSYTPTSKIVTSIADRLLTLGFRQNTFDQETKWRFLPDTALGANAQIYRLDVNDLDADDFMDRYVYTYGPTVYQDITNNLSTNAGYQFQYIDFNQAPNKSMTADKGFLGFTQKLPGKFNFSANAIFQRFFMKNKANNGPTSQTSDWGGSVLLDTVFSLYTKIGVSVFFNQVQPSSRSEYVKYHDNGVNLNVKHYITPKLIALGDVGFERLNFRPDDAYIGVEKDSKNINVTLTGLALERILNNWLSLNCAYRYTRRNSKFAQDSYSDNQVTVSLKANY